MRVTTCIALAVALFPSLIFGAWPPEQEHYWASVRPIMDVHCSLPCHNADDNKAGLNLFRYDFLLTIKQEGHVIEKVIEHLEDRTMPPPERTRLTKAEVDTLVFYFGKYLDDALSSPDPGIIQSRRLSNREYAYVMKDLLDIDVKTDSIFPSDASGGEGFDNFARTLFFTPLQMERYFAVAEYAIETIYLDSKKWRTYVSPHRLHIGQWLKNIWFNLRGQSDYKHDIARLHAEDNILPFATHAYRRYLSIEEKNDLMGLFSEVYQSDLVQTRKYDTAIKEVFKAILVSPNFLMRQEADPELDKPYTIGGFELASRLSFFLWSSIPDQELLNVAYRENLHKPEVLFAQVDRMMQSPKIRRLAESFVTQWLEVENLKDPTFNIDEDIFPTFSNSLRDAMYEETVTYFHHAFSEEKNLLRLIDGDYTFLNEMLAKHYGIEGVEGEELRKVNVSDKVGRGGILGMAGVLTATSLPNRTSPVLRGKWVMEKMLATKAKPPPPNTPELEATKEAHDELDLREVLVLHRQDPNCAGCHKDMDDLGFALENFDAIGRWRQSYRNDGKKIDVSGVLQSGEQFEGPIELKELLLTKKDQFAKGISRKMLGFALGREILFYDKPAIDSLTNTLLENDFDPQLFVHALVSSYPFRYKKSDPVVVDNDLGEEVL